MLCVALAGLIRTKLRAWFQDRSGADLCGAFFVTVRRK